MEQDFLCDNGALWNIIFQATSCILILPGWKQRMQASHVAIFFFLVV